MNQILKEPVFHHFEPVHHYKILAISDYTDKHLVHYVETNQIKEIDLIISCGDIEPELLTFLREKLSCPLYYIKGNHDLRYTPYNPNGCENIHGKIIKFGSLNILGLEGSMWYNGGPNQYTESMMKKLLFKLKFKMWLNGPVHMVVTHAPPRSIHDREDLCHTGFNCYRRLISKNRPAYFIHGHIHQQFENFEARMTTFNTTRVINTCGYTLFEV